jgi:hypothetical protein
MRLTKKQRELLEEARAIAYLTNLDFYLIETKNIDRTMYLAVAIHKMVIAEVVIRYTFLDEILADLIAKYYFKTKTRLDFVKLWRTNKFRMFVHHILDELYLPQKDGASARYQSATNGREKDNPKNQCCSKRIRSQPISGE